jgi:hypothetical protein
VTEVLTSQATVWLAKAASLRGVTALAPDGSTDVLFTCEDDETTRVAFETMRDEGVIEWTGPRSFYLREAAKGHRRCESCGMAMRPRLYRARDDDQRLVCDGCKANGLGPKEWNVAYASLPPGYQREAQVRHEATVAGLAVLAEVRKCPACGGQGTYEDDETGQERACLRCNGDGVLDVKKTSAQDDQATVYVVTVPGQEGFHPEIRWDDSFGKWICVDDDMGRFATGNSVAVVLRSIKGRFGSETTIAPKTGGLQTVAHDSGDGETIFHCPFCGSGAVAGGHDGTVTCDFCHTAFTVQVQPTHTNMPQTVNGQPYNIPGMPGGGPDAGAAQQQDRQDQGDAQDGAPQPGDNPAADANKGNSPAADRAAQDGSGPAKPNPFAKGSSIPAGAERCEGSGAPAIDASWGDGATPTRTGQCPVCGNRWMLTISGDLTDHPTTTFATPYVAVQGGVLPIDKALQAIALAHADDREAVLAQVRQENVR